MSKVRDCKYCHRRISIRQMPFGQWVAFDVPDNTPHDCDQPVAPNPANAAQSRPQSDRAGWRESRRQAVLVALRDLPVARLAAIQATTPALSAQRLALDWANDLVDRLGLAETVRSVRQATFPKQGIAQDLLSTVEAGETVSLTSGLATGPVVVAGAVAIEGKARDDVHFWSGDGPAIVIDAGDSDVTLRRITVNADSAQATILLQRGSLRLEDCVVSGRIGIMVAEGAGPLTVIGSRIVCPDGGFGIVAGPGTSISVAQIWVGSHQGIGILGMTGSAIEYDDYRFVGDDGIDIHSQEV